MTKEETYDLLKEKGIEFEAFEHPAIFTMGELDMIDFPHPEWEAKNLFIRDDKKRNYYLITVKGDKRVDINTNPSLKCRQKICAKSIYARFCLIFCTLYNRELV